MQDTFSFFATTPKGLELLLVEELRALGAQNVAEKLAGVVFTGNLETAYQVCLWSRLANRILLNIKSFPARTPDELYAGVQSIAWQDHIDPAKTLAVHCVCRQSQITHSLYAAQKVKDAIVDQLRQRFNTRPNVSRTQPDVSVYVYLNRDVATVSIDLSGESLHKRGYRQSAGTAPLKENLAAAILLRAHWSDIAKAGGCLMDPMCGSGTFLIEAALIAGDIAPGLLHQYFGFLGWKQHDPILWQRLRTDAEERRAAGVSNLPVIIGYDRDPQAIKMSFENIDHADLRGKIHVEKREVAVFAPRQNLTPGLVVVNPPYGERIGEITELKSLYHLLGDKLKQHFIGFNAAILTGNPELGKQMGLRAKRTYQLYNGALSCKLLLFEVSPEYFVDNSPAATNERVIKTAQRSLSDKDRAAVQMFCNRLQKKLKHYKQRKALDDQPLVTAATQPPEDRIYDADIPEYAFTIDLTPSAAYVHEYRAPRFVDKVKVEQRRNAVLAVLPELLGLSPQQIYFCGEIEKDKQLSE